MYLEICILLRYLTVEKKSNIGTTGEGKCSILYQIFVACTSSGVVRTTCIPNLSVDLDYMYFLFVSATTYCCYTVAYRRRLMQAVSWITFIFPNNDFNNWLFQHVTKVPP